MPVITLHCIDGATCLEKFRYFQVVAQWRQRLNFLAGPYNRNYILFFKILDFIEAGNKIALIHPIRKRLRICNFASAEIHPHLLAASHPICPRRERDAILRTFMRRQDNSSAIRDEEKQIHKEKEKY